MRAYTCIKTAKAAVRMQKLPRLHTLQPCQELEEPPVLVIVKEVLQMLSLHAGNLLKLLSGNLQHQASRPRIRVSDDCRHHPLFPMLDFMIKQHSSHAQTVSSLDGKLTEVKKDCDIIKKAQAELKMLIDKVEKKNFSIKDSTFEVSNSAFFLSYYTLLLYINFIIDPIAHRNR